MGRLIIDGNSVYELDEECMRRREQKEGRRESERGEERGQEEEEQGKRRK